MLQGFTTPSGLCVERRRTDLTYASALDGFAERLDRERGVLFSSGFDYPGRYSRWEFGFANAPLEIVGRERALSLRALNPRGEALLRLLAPIAASTPDTVIARDAARELALEIQPGTRVFREEERSLQPSLVSPLRRCGPDHSDRRGGERRSCPGHTPSPQIRVRFRPPG